MKLQKLKDNYFLLSFFAVVLLIGIFGSIEVLRGDSLSRVAGVAMLALFVILSGRWIQKGHAEWILYLYIFIQPMTHFPVYLIGGLRLSFVLLILSVVGCIYGLWKKRNWHALRLSSLVLPQLLFVGAVILSTLVHINSISNFERVVLHVANLGFVVATLQLVDSHKKLIRLVKVWCASLTVLAVFGILVSLFARINGETTSIFIQTSIDGIIRISSLTPDSNYFAVLFWIPLAIGLAALFSQKVRIAKKYRYFFWMFVPLAITTVLLTYSRAGLIALGIVIVSFFFFERQYLRYTYWVKMGIVIGVSLVLCVLIQPEFIRNMILRFPDSVISQDQKIQYGTALTFDKSALIFHGSAYGLVKGSGQPVKPELDQNFQENISDEAIDVRGLYWQVATKMFLANPIVGVGAGGYPAHFEKYLGYSYWTKHPNTHNIVLETAAEFGIIGLVALAALFVRAFLLLYNLYHFSVGAMRILLYALGTAFLASLFQFMFQPSFNSLNLWLIFGMLGIVEMLSVSASKKFHEALIQK